MPNLVSDARALPAGGYGHIVVYGSLLVGDGGGGFYVWSAAATNIDDGADWIKPDSITHPAPGRWQRVWSMPQLASALVPGLAQLGANGETTSGRVLQCNDTRLHPALSIAGTPNYISIDAATQIITSTLVDLASHVTGNLPVANMNGGAGAAASTFWNGVGAWAEPPSADPVTMSGTPDYLTLAGQDIVRALVDLSTDFTDFLPQANAARWAIVTNTGSARGASVTAAEADYYVRWTSNSGKTFTINNNIASPGDVWQGFNATTTTNTTQARLTIAPGAGVTLTGVLTFARWKMYSIMFRTTSLADVIGGA